MDYTLTLVEDRLHGGGWLALPALNRVLYVRAGRLLVTHASQVVDVPAAAAWHGRGACSVSTHGPGATVLRFELRSAAQPDAPTWPGVESRPLLEHTLTLDPEQPYLMRCDRVEFAPGGEALPHGHKGGGIRYLLSGELEVRIAGRPGRVMKPGDTWFESGVEPVHAIASASDVTAFVRVAILPRAIRGRSSIEYVNPADAGVKPRTYTVYVDEPIELA